MDTLGAVVALLSFLVHHAASQTGPSQCTYADEVYTCDYTQMTSSDRPVDFYQFSVQPQQLVLEVNGLLPYFGDTLTFTTGFSTSIGMNVSSLNENYPASLTVDCGRQGSVYIYSTAFYFMEYVEHFKIRNCETYYIGADVFSFFEELDYFSFEGGSLDQIEFSSMSGLTVQKLSSSTHKFPRQQGKVEVVNTRLIYGIVTPWLLTFFTSASSIILKNNGIAYITSSQFSTNLNVTTIDLSDNIFPILPGDVFSNLKGLSEVTLYNIPWECACADFQWLTTAINNNIIVRGDLMCANKNGVSVLKYYHDNCAADAVCEGTMGIAFGDKCLTLFGLVAVSLGCLAFICTCAALVVAIVNFQNIERSDEPDPILLERLKRKAKQRWIKATRTIIYAKRTGRHLAAFESKSSIQTMSIPDETRTIYDGTSRNTFDSSIPDFYSLNSRHMNRSSPGHSGSPDSYGRMHRVHSLSNASYADFPEDMDNAYRR